MEQLVFVFHVANHRIRQITIIATTSTASTSSNTTTSFVTIGVGGIVGAGD